jgi:RHS repeat-associated protein
MVSKTDAKGVTIGYQYDAANRLTKIDFSTDTDILYAYDNCLNGKGHLCSMTDESGTTTYEYTPKGQVKKETKTIDSIQYVTQYTYDQNGNLKTMTYPSGKVITYNYANDRATSVLNGAVNLATNIQYKPFGGMTSLTLGNGLSQSIGYDNQYKITSMVTGTIQNLSYSAYDYNRNVQTITNNAEPAKNKTFGYDALDRLSTATGLWGSLGWTYDGAGNRLTENTNSYTYVDNTNKLSSANGLSYGFDNNGNMITEGARAYTYNQNQRLSQAVNGAITANYIYNGYGQRVKKIVNGVATVFHYNLNGQIITESNSAGNISAEYVYLNSAPLVKLEGTNAYYYTTDHFGAPQKLTDAFGTIVWAADYKPFGEATIAVSTITNNLGFPGQYRDAETGMLYNYFRDYNPVLGKYTQADPIGLSGGINPFAYVGNNPINFRDPLGLWAAGFNLEVSTINPFTSGSGGSYGINLQYTSDAGWHLYTYGTPNDTGSVGFLPGVSLTGNVATGNGDWTGPFESGNGSFGPFTGGYFQTPANQPDPGYFGLTFGGALGPPGLGFTSTTYKRTFPDTPCK